MNKTWTTINYQPTMVNSIHKEPWLNMNHPLNPFHVNMITPLSTKNLNIFKQPSPWSTNLQLLVPRSSSAPSDRRTAPWSTPPASTRRAPSSTFSAAARLFDANIAGKEPVLCEALSCKLVTTNLVTSWLTTHQTIVLSTTTGGYPSHKPTWLLEGASPLSTVMNHD